MVTKKEAPNSLILDKLEEVLSAVKSRQTVRCGTGSNAVYGLGMIGAAFYYFQHMPANSDLVMTIFRIIFWPAVLVYELLNRFPI